MRAEETCRLLACVVNRDCVIAILRSVVCSSTKIATESTVGLCENTRTLSPLSSCATARPWTIFRNLRGQLDSTGQWNIRKRVHHRHWSNVDDVLVNDWTSPCVTVWFVRQSKLYIILYVRLWAYAYCILSLPLINLFTIIHILFIVQNLSTFQFLLWPCPGLLFWQLSLTLLRLVILSS